ncbi:MAG: type II toxin-antitoxin system RelE/ParE family toxin [Nitrososphaerota archaeon]|jgi:mRNA interferase RelE/StbE|nr:type II toxin-antitoxin system RelE/ParE family toxin [Nitrososphaerota archaeon]
MKTKYNLVLSVEALKQAKDLDKPVRDRIFKELPFLESHPMSGKLLTGDLRGALSFRVGKYRVIYRLSECKIIVVTILHRKKVYDL